MDHIDFTEILLIFAVVIIIAIAFLLIPYWRIFKKAGFPGALSLLMLLPIVNVIMLYYLAFADWPSLKQNQLSR
jgi:hypothetical protein